MSQSPTSSRALSFGASTLEAESFKCVRVLKP